MLLTKAEAPRDLQCVSLVILADKCSYEIMNTYTGLFRDMWGVGSRIWG